MGFILGASIVINILLFAVVRVLTRDMKVEIQSFKVCFRELLEYIEDDYTVNGTEHKLYAHKQYHKCKGYLEKK